MYIIIAGCRKVGSNLAISLSQSKHDVVVIDSDPSNFELLGSGFNGLTITGMPIDEDVLRSAGIEKADALAAVSNDDNINFMISQVASKIFHVPRVITRVYDPERKVVLSKMGMLTICPTVLAVEIIRSCLVSSEPQESHVIQGTKIAFSTVRAGKNLIGKNICELKANTIMGLVRDQKLLLARPGLMVQENDLIMTADYVE